MREIAASKVATAAGIADAGASLPVEKFPPAATAWAGVSLLLMAYTFCFLDRQILSVLVQPVKTGLQLTDTEISMLQGLSFALFYSALGLPFGMLADRVHRRNIVFGALLLWSGATVLCGLSHTFGQLFFSRMLVGIGEAALQPAAYSIIFDLFRPNLRGRAITMYTSGVYLGSGVAYVAGGQVVLLANRASAALALHDIHYQGWQVAFMIAGLAGVLLAPLLFVLREPARKGRASASISQEVEESSEGRAFLHASWRFSLPYMMAMSCIAIVSYNFFSWTLVLFERKFAYPVQSIALDFGLILLVCGPLGMSMAGNLVDRTPTGGRREVRGVLVATVACALVLPFALLATLTNSPRVSLLGVAGVIVLIALPTTMGPFVLQTTTPNRFRGLSVSVYLLMVTLIGLGVGPTISAMLADGLHVNLDRAIAITSAIFMPIGLGLFVLSYRQVRHVKSYA